MSTKTLITVFLLAFVGVSLAVVLREEAGRKDAVASRGAEEDRTAGRQVVAYYFHGSQRCNTCRTIEAYTAEALQAQFSAEIARSELVWRPTNIEEPANDHFVKDFALTTRTVVLVEVTDGVPDAWRKLDEVWELVGDHDAFVAYVQSETGKLLGAPRG